MVMRFYDTVGLVLTELRDVQSQHWPLAGRGRRLEEEAGGAVVTVPSRG